MRKAQQVVEISRWMFPAFILSGYLSPLVLLFNLLSEVFQWL